MKTIKRTKGKHSNNLEFYTTDLYGPDVLIVKDHDCQRERQYTMGYKGDLTNSGVKDTDIISYNQVIDAWETGKVWF